MTRYLSEVEVADLYRDRFRGEREQIDRLDEVSMQLLEAIDTTDWPWLLAALVPNSPGSLSISGPGLAAMQQWCAIRDFGDGFHDQDVFGDLPAVGVGVRRYTLSSGHDRGAPPRFIYGECHTDGSAAAALAFRPLEPEPGTGRTVMSHDLVKHAATVLGIAGRHAYENAGARGDAAIALRLVGPQMHLGTYMGIGPARVADTRPISREASSRHTMPLDWLAGETQQLLAATALGLGDIYNAFGRPEVTFLRSDGALRRPYWADARIAWAEAHDVDIVDEEAPS